MIVANVTHILEYKNRDTVAVLTELLHQASNGKLHGVAFIAKMSGARKHRLGITGEYWHDPTQGLGAAVRLLNRINEHVAEVEKANPPPDTGHAPLDEIPPSRR